MEMDQGVFLRSIIFEADLPNFNSGSERSAFCRAVARGRLYTCEGVQYPMSSDVWGWVRAGPGGLPFPKGSCSMFRPLVFEAEVPLNSSSSKDWATMLAQGEIQQICCNSQRFHASLVGKFNPNAISWGWWLFLNHLFHHSLSVTLAAIQKVIKNKLVNGQLVVQKKVWTFSSASIPINQTNLILARWTTVV